jgi:hypothetical protein
MRVLIVIALCGCSTRDAAAPDPAECVAVAPATPVPAPAPALIRGSIAAGMYHACAIEATGRVACWGKAGNGRLGTPDRADHLTPVEVPGLDDIAGLAAGTDITCAWTAHGAVWCWGDNWEYVNAHVPRRVPHLDDIVQVVAGLFGACGLHASGRVACWPIDAWKNPLWPRVEDIEGIEHAVEIAGDNMSLCARLASGQVTCNYALDIHHEKAFHLFAELDGAISMAGSDEKFAALLPGHQLAVWNIADFEDRRGGHTATIHRVDGVDGTRVVVGDHDVCVLGEAARCWSIANLDPPAADARSRARMLSGSVRDVAPGHEISCVRDGDRVRCWGEHPSALVENLVLGPPRPVVPTTPPPEPVATAPGTPIDVKPRPMRGPYRDEVTACRAQGCPAPGLENFCHDLAAQCGPAGCKQYMNEPPAPFSIVRLVAFDCRNPDNPPDDFMRMRIMVTRDDGVWLSAPLFVVGAPGEQCDEVLDPEWQTRKLGGKPSVVLSVVAGTACEGRGDDQAARIVVAGDAKRPYTYAPIETGASRKGRVARHAIAFGPDRLVVDGVASYRFTAETRPATIDQK